jgi:uncharacterized protein (DUF305 family)
VQGSRLHPVRSAFLSIAALVLGVAAIPARAHAQGPNDHTAADVAFVQGMIAHHAQAVVMSDWAPTHGASPAVATLCKRIALSQRDEIHMMQQWLQDRHLPTPDPLHMLHGDSAASHDTAMRGMDMHAAHAMPGMQTGGDSTMAMMPGMLTPAQLRALDAARGPEFDRLYLTGMIRHHEGALKMVADLFATPGSGQQADLFGFATDVDAGQRAEIGRMEALLDTLTPSPTR